MDLKKLGICLGSSFVAGGLGSWFTSQSINTWYTALKKPEFTPPGWLFAPVWTLLYILMGTAMYFVWQQAKNRQTLERAAILFGTQLTLNAAWSAVFFGMRSPVGGLWVITALWMSITGTILAFRQVSRCATWLLLPYLLWVSYAAVLNYSIWKLNK